MRGEAKSTLSSYVHLTPHFDAHNNRKEGTRGGVVYTMLGALVTVAGTGVAGLWFKLQLFAHGFLCALVSTDTRWIKRYAI